MADSPLAHARGGNYSNTKVNDFTENGSTGVELTYDDQWINSLQSVLGVQGSAAFSTGLGILVSQVNADYIHEFANSQRLIHVQFAEDLRAIPTKFTFQNDVPVRNYFNLGTGFILVLPNGWQPFVNFRAMVGNNLYSTLNDVHPALFTTVRREIAKPRRETGAQSLGNWLRRLTSASSVEPRRCLSHHSSRRSSESAIAAEALMNNAG